MRKTFLTLDYIHWSLIGAVLLIGLSFFGKTKTWTKQIEQLTAEKTTLSDSLAIQKTENASLRKEIRQSEVTEPVVVKVNGIEQVVMVTRKTSESVEIAMRQATEQVAQLKNQVSTLEVSLKSKESLVVKAAPFWNVVAGWAPIGQGYYLGGGVNLGPLSVSVINPVAWALEPQLLAAIRF